MGKGTAINKFVGDRLSLPAVPPPDSERLGTSHLRPPQLVPSGVFFSVIEEKAKAPGLTGTQTMLMGPGSPVLLNPVQLCTTVSQ